MYFTTGRSKVIGVFGLITLALLVIQKVTVALTLLDSRLGSGSVLKLRLNCNRWDTMAGKALLDRSRQLTELGCRRTDGSMEGTDDLALGELPDVQVMDLFNTGDRLDILCDFVTVHE